MTTTQRFPGLDSLRFFAALFVVIGHVPMTQAAVNLPAPAWSAAFFRGAHAVCFFFALSGFLITYLLLAERERTGGIDVRRFYLRRVCRIWPLYFAVVAGGLVFYRLLLPRLGIEYPVAYSLSTALLLYTLFLPNLMNSLYRVGGILNPLWSIGLEEQFYLAWAPLLKKVRDRLPALCALVLAGSFALFLLNEADVLGGGRAHYFFAQLKFHFMAVGGLWAWAVYRHRDRLLALPLFRGRAVRLALLALLVEHYFVGRLARQAVVAEVLQLLLYGWLIVEVGVNPRRLVRLANPVCEYLGRISYGIYMLHMPVVYAAAELFRRTRWWQGASGADEALYLAAFYAIAVGGTIAAAAASYHWFEQPFLRLKERFGGTPIATPVAADADSVTLPIASADAAP
ncbi:MAG TPA: acyltransferase [Thermoanaerobaculia bacterium]|jgi:peptidoglycan/LPS O-acetylase OafA/YrhL|nr:acyltransferase [Thermoanaerobaculia bacterium]